ncbi:MAG TPA: hypothetical protein VHA75_13590, partial [Rugosimonospora sp.]|nr:hypothetical protein [Rugosimonospora sp.]
MATPEERITDPGPVDVIALPTTGRTVRGKARKATAEQREAFRRQLATRAVDVTDGPTAAGLAVHSTDTGRVLMLQRAMTDDDPAAG